ncbi:hypothetical protein EJ04DRAFT_514556 [Polyplosphaeria fusca]|uniref:Uncharacterized protein n=1 Tax=Polyplosphaeria fusca TaxID=682080 RepID=A0A9P4QPT3_9PLEO|nr:hypothetical protein EJ04DRAFT_514556 [Polyplosphaeria fusca]
MTTNGELSSTPMTNGDKSHSKALSHLQSWPVIHDGLEFYKTNPYGAKSLALFNNTYQRFVAPLHPYLQTPYSYLSPYLSRADELGDSGLSHVDAHFPIVKEDTSKLKEKVQGVAFLPFALAGKGKQYLFSAWNDEYSKTRGDDGLAKNVKAFISTELRIGHDGYKLVREYLQKGKQEASKRVEDVKQ